MRRILRVSNRDDNIRKCIAVLIAVFFTTLLFFVVYLFREEGIGIGESEATSSSSTILFMVFPKEMNSSNNTTSHRKLLQSNGDGDGEGNRIGTECSKEEILIFQGSTSPLPNGIPAYTVQILNVCVSGCSISDIHVSCGWFSSARLVNPRIFRRLYYDDCLVNDGEALGPGETLSFQYANSFRYPLSVTSVSCCY